MRVAALCAGYGGLELGLAMAGVDVDLAWFAEIDPHAAAVMSAHHPGVPNLGDLTAITDPPPVDLIAAGFPCQPVSVAGARKGTDDARWLIRDVVAVARAARAHTLILENVPGLLTANDGEAFRQVLAALAEGGFDVRWTSLRASDVGAAHRRERWFAIAHPDGVKGGSQPVGVGRGGDPLVARLDRQAPPDTASARRQGGQWVRPEPSRLGSSGRGGEAPADPGGVGRVRGARVRGARRDTAERCETVDHAGDCDRPCTFGPYAAAVHRWERVVGRPASRPTDDLRRLDPVFVEWLMGLPAGWVTDVINVRRHALRVLGNGVVPQQAAVALAHLLDLDDTERLTA